MFDMQCGKVQDAIHPSLNSGETTFLFHISHFSIYHLSVWTLNLIREPVFQRICRFVQLHIKAYNDHITSGWSLKRILHLKLKGKC